MQLPFKLMIYSCYIYYQRVQQHSLCIGLAHTPPPTNINFRITFLLTQLLEALYEDLHVQSIKLEVYHHFSGLSFIVEVNFWHPLITVVSCDLFITIIIIIIIHFFRRVFSECTEVIATSLIPTRYHSS